MQNAGDATTEEGGSTITFGISRWFPNGFSTVGVDWASLEEHLDMANDLAFEVTSVGSSTSERGDNMPRGVCALHLAVACCNPSAPLSLVQRLIDVNPDALHQIEATSGWNVLHCALKFNRSLSPDISLVKLLVHSKPDLVTEGATAVEHFGLLPLAYANSKEVVSLLVKLMPTNEVTSVLKKVFNHRKLLGGSIEAMEEIVREVSKWELEQKRAILEPGIVPSRIARKQALIEYSLGQVAKRRKSSSERHNLMRLSNLFIQAKFCLAFQKEGDHDNTLHSCPSPLECLKALVAKQKTKRKVLGLYESIQYTNEDFIENVDLLQLEHGNPLLSANDSIHNLETLTEDVKRTAQEIRLEARREEQADPFVQVRLNTLLKRKEQLDAKIEASLEVMRQTAISLEGYRDMYSKTVDSLCQEAKAVSAQKSDAINNNTHQAASTDPTDENMASIRARVALSSLPPKHPRRLRSGSICDDRDSLALELSLQEAIENMTAANDVVNRYNKCLNSESNILVQEQEEQKAFDLALFRDLEHAEMLQAMARINELVTQREVFANRTLEIKEQLRAAKSLGDRKSQIVEVEALTVHWNEQKQNMSKLQEKIDLQREIVTRWRQKVGRRMIKARRVVKDKNRCVSSRRTARRFLCKATMEMKSVLSQLSNAGMTKRQQNKLRRKQLRKETEENELNLRAEDEELARRTKRMKL